MLRSMKTFAFVLYPGLTPLDLVGPLQVLAGFAGATDTYRVVTVAETLDPLPTDSPLGLSATHRFDDVPEPFAVVVPGGEAPTLRALRDRKLLDYLREAAATAEYVTSVCTGALVLGAAGLLDGRRATTHWMFRNALAAFGASPVDARWVEDGPVITAAGVAAGIDMALHLVGKLGGEQAERLVQFAVEYDPQPPLGPLDWTEAPRALMTPRALRTIADGLADAPDLAARLRALL
jgi:transcriptional regulator GlxA family with amidase domain